MLGAVVVGVVVGAVVVGATVVVAAAIALPTFSSTWLPGVDGTFILGS